MKVVYNWLKDFVDVAATPQELALRLALSGTNIGGVENGAHGAVIEAEVSSNRPDCLGHYGIAREVAAIYKLSLKHVSPKPAETAEKAGDAVKVEIQTPDLCGRFTARVIRNVKIQPSPKWLKDRLEASGVASISNVVDISNYVMLELGHPLHTFDYDKIRDHSIVVRGANPRASSVPNATGAKIKTLDGVEGQLDSGACVICDGHGSRIVGVGGIMGGAETEISFSTKNVLIECAWFDPIAIRRATRSLKLHTEASTRFGRGADPEMAELASRRCAELILQLAGGELLSGGVDLYPGKRAALKIILTRAEFLRIMGADVLDNDIEVILKALGFAPVRIDQNRGTANSLLAAWECTQPSWRADVEREIDLIEEIARVRGLDKFPPRLPASNVVAARLPHYEAETRFRERLIGLGYREIVTITQVAEERNDLFRPPDAVVAKMLNPLSEEASVLKSTGAVTMAAAIEWNLNHAQRGEIRLNKPDGPVLGAAGQVSKRILEKLKFRQEVFIAELQVGPLYCMYYGTKNNPRFKPLPRFPGVERDFSLLLANNVTFAEVKKAIDSLQIPEIASVQAMDLFRGKFVPEGKYSLLVRVLFQSSEATLTEPQLNAFSTRIITALEKAIGATLRAS